MLSQHNLLFKRGLTWIVDHFFQICCETISLGVPATRHRLLFAVMTAFNEFWSLKLGCTGELFILLYVILSER